MTLTLTINEILKELSALTMNELSKEYLLLPILKSVALRPVFVHWKVGA